MESIRVFFFSWLRCSETWGKIPIVDAYFSTGWLNHQLAYLYIPTFCSNKPDYYTSTSTDFLAIFSKKNRGIGYPSRETDREYASLPQRHGEYINPDDIESELSSHLRD